MDKERLRKIESKFIVDEIPHPEDIREVEKLIKANTESGNTLRLETYTKNAITANK